ncbi:MAG: hypothetical protein JWP78_2968 [Mucilaginibacter sp.]|nr:hypothetical protein [Mucilaginibacter sp.]
MKFFRSDLLTLLISLFILNSCKNKDTIGLDLNSSTRLGGSLIDTATIIVNTLKEDSVPTTSLAKTPMGYFIDPVLGTIESNVAVGLNLPSSSAYTLPTGTISIDSAVLVLRYTDGFYGDSLTSKYKVNVYQLTERPLNQTYYNNKVWLYNSGNLLGTRSFSARTHDSVKIMNIITGAPDTLIKVVPQLRIPIDKTFINTVLFNAGSAQLASNVVFQNNVKGLYITLDKSGTTGAGGTMMFDLADSSKINVYYRAVSGTTIDTAVVSLPLGTHAAEIKHTLSTAVTTDINDTSSSKKLIYLQGLAGTKVRIKFPYLKSIIKNTGNIVINRAELVITPQPTSIIPFKAQPKLTMYRYDIAHQRAELQDANLSDPRSMGVGTFGGYYSSSLKDYHFIITAYIQDLINGKSVDYGTYLAPVDTTNTTSVDISPTPQTAGRTIAVGTDNSANRIKLNIIYTKINK